MKLKLHNHEVWHICINCGTHYDVRNEGTKCPVCGTDWMDKLKIKN